LEPDAYVALVCDFLERIPSEMVVQRLTSDPHPGELAAPAWALNKSETLDRIRKTLEKRDSWQGKLFRGS
jgi:radical SAM superfamily enzyme